MPNFTASHWGIYNAEPGVDGELLLKPHAQDPDPSPIGEYQLAPDLMKLRIKRPAVRRSWLREGAGAATHLRGREPLVEISWDEALDLAAAEIARVRDTHGNASIFGGCYGWASAGRFHHAQSQAHRFLNLCGGYVRHLDSYSLGAGRVLLPYIVGPFDQVIAWHSSWDVMAEHTELFVTFGGVPAKNAQVAAGGSLKHKVKAGLYAMGEAGVRFINVGPVDDNLETGEGHEWIAIRPNTDTAFMLGLAWVLREEGLHDRQFLARYCQGYDVFERYLLGLDDGLPKTPEWAARITEVPAEAIVDVARQMAGSRTMLNIAWALQRSDNGEQPFWMLITLACMLGQIGLPGGGFALGLGATNQVGSPNVRLSGPTLSQGQNDVTQFIPVARVADMLLEPKSPFTYRGETHYYPDIRLVFWAGGNPFHHHQDLNRLLRAWQRPETIIVNEQFWTPTAKYADIVFPVTTSMERSDIGFANNEGHLVAMRPIIDRVGESRDDYDIFTGLAQRLGIEEKFTEGLDEAGWLKRLYEEFRSRISNQGMEIPDFDIFWEDGLIDFAAHDTPFYMFKEFRADPDAHPLPTPSGKIEIYSETIASFGLDDCPGHPVWREPAEWLGGRLTKRFPLHMISDQPVRRLHSQLDASPHSKAGKVNGREPVDIHPADAADRGLSDGDLVELFNDRGRCISAARITPNVRRGVVKLSTGAWFDPDWETGLDKHGNPNTLTLDIGASGLSQGCSAQTCLVDIRKWAGEVAPISAFNLPDLTNER